MKQYNPVELKSFIDGIILKILKNVKSSEKFMMKFIQFYIDTENENIKIELERNRKRFIDLRDDIATYRIPPIILKTYKNETNLLNQIQIVLFFFELILIESNTFSNELEDGYNSIGNEKELIFILENLLDKFNRINKLFRSLETEGNVNLSNKGFESILSNVKQIYSDPEYIEKIIEISKKLNLTELERQKLPTISEEESVVSTFLKRFSHKKSELIEIINSISQSEFVKLQGGIVDITKIFNLIMERKNIELDLGELNNILNFMKKKGYISDIMKISNTKVIKFYPVQLTNDPKLLLAVVGDEGVETRESLIKKLNWSEARLENVLIHLIESGICKIGEKSILNTNLYFPGLKT